MRITGIIRSIGDHDICENYPQDWHDDLNFDTVKGIVITCDDDPMLRLASNLLHATVDIYPHPVDGLRPGECTPENYAHALARLAHAEDHLAREVRSSQTAHANIKDLERRLADDGNARLAAHLEAMDAECRKQLAEQEATKSAAWEKYLDLRKQVRRAAEDKRPDAEVHTLMNEALTIAREYDLDPTTLELEEARRTIDALHAQIALTPKDIADAQRVISCTSRENEELTKENHELRAENGALRIANAAIAAKQAEQERLMTAYRVQYHEADRALNRAQADLAETKLRLAHHPALPSGATEELATALAGCCSWSLRVNDHRSCYESIRDHITNSAHCGGEEPDEELITECETSGAVYELQVYERTPVSFVIVKAASFAALLDEVRDHKWQHISPVMNRDPT